MTNEKLHPITIEAINSFNRGTRTTEEFEDYLYAYLLDIRKQEKLKLQNESYEFKEKTMEQKIETKKDYLDNLEKVEDSKKENSKVESIGEIIGKGIVFMWISLFKITIWIFKLCMKFTMALFSSMAKHMDSEVKKVKSKSKTTKKISSKKTKKTKKSKK